MFNDEFSEWNLPEIQTMPIDNVILQIKSMKINKITNFPFPTPPDKQSIVEAEKRLILLGALEVYSNVTGKLIKLDSYLNFYVYTVHT